MWKASLAIISLGMVVSGCGGYAEGTEDMDMAAIEDVDSLESAACSNPEGANYSLAALAAATAMELKRWQTAKDFAVVVKCNYSMAGCQEVVELTSVGKAACGGECKNVQAILDFQKKEASGKIVFPGGATLQSDIFAQRLVANLKNQITCNSQPDNHNGNNCPVEAHTLDFSKTAPGGCETDFWFHAYKAGSTTKAGLAYPAQLKNQLITFGSLAGNNYLAFDVEGDDVKVDPGPGTVVGDPATSGACPTVPASGAVLTKGSPGGCCYLSTTQKKLVRSTFNTNYYYCTG
jgi:hypothetical protein